MEPDQRNAFAIEKTLNNLGYYCVAQPATIKEGLVLSQFNGIPFDVLLAPEHLIKPSPESIFPLHGFNIKNIFIYACPIQSNSFSARLNWTLHHSSLPDFKSLQSFMACVERGTSLHISKSA